LVLADLEGLKVGLLICYDIEFPEASRMLALAGAELIAVPTALMEPYCRTTRIIIPARAYENQLFVAYVNPVALKPILPTAGSAVLSDRMEKIL
jgi:predicted amidohydrolase